MTADHPVPTWIDAAARAVVRLPDGRTGRLVSVPMHHGENNHRQGDRRRNRAGTKARVMIRPGLFLSVPVSDLTLVSPET